MGRYGITPDCVYRLQSEVVEQFAPGVQDALIDPVKDNIEHNKTY